MGRIDLERGAIGVLDSGDGRAALPIVFLHGVGSDKSVWLPQLEHFGALRRAVALDYPGYGESDQRPAAGRDGFAAAMLETLDALDIRRFHLCGLSLGGVIAIAMHHVARQRCASLILADSFALHPDGQGIFDRSVAASDDMAAMAAARVPALLGDDPPDDLAGDLVRVMADIDPAAFRQGAEAVWLADQRDRAAAIEAPTLVIVGERDTITPPRLSEELAALIRGARMEIIGGAGHLTNIERPVAFNALVERFIASAEL